MYYPIFGVQNHNLATAVAPNFQSVAATAADLWRTGEASVVHTVPTAMQLSNFYVECQNAPGIGQSMTYTIRKNGADTGLTLTFSGGSQRSGLINGPAVSFAAGDTISFSATPSAVANNPGIMWWSLLANGNAQNLFIGNHAGSFPSTSVTEYSSILSGGFSNWDTEVHLQAPVAAAGTFSDLCMNTDVAPGGSASYAFKVRKAATDTSLAATISAAALLASDHTHTVAVAAGDLVSLSSTPTGPPATPGNVNFSLAFTPTTPGDSIFSFSAASGNGSLTAVNNSLPFGQGFNWDNFVDENNDYVEFGPCVIKAFYVNLAVAPGAATSVAYTLRKNRVDTAATVSIANTNTSGNISTAVAVSQGDKMTFSSTPTGTIAASARLFGYCLHIQQAQGFYG